MSLYVPWQRIRISKIFLSLMSLVLPVTYFTLASLFILKNLIPNRTETKYFADPDYVYLLNGLVLNARLSPLHVDHPGTPLQALNTLLINIVHQTNLLGTKNFDLVESVTLKPQEHLVVLAFLLAFAQALSLFLVGLRLMKYIPFEFALVTQAVPLIFLSTSLSEHFVRNRPEALLLALLLLVSYGLIPFVFTNLSGKKIKAALILSSILLGVSAAVKINAWIIALIIPFIFRKPRWIASSYVIIGFSFLISLIPIMPRALMAIGFWTSFTGTGRDSLFDIQGWLLAPSIGFFRPVGIFGPLVGIFFLIYFVKTRHAASKKIMSLRFQLRPPLLYAGLVVVVVLTSLVLANARNAPWFIPAIPFLGLGYASCLWGIWVLMGGSDTKNLESGIKL